MRGHQLQSSPCVAPRHLMERQLMTGQPPMRWPAAGLLPLVIARAASEGEP